MLAHNGFHCPPQRMSGQLDSSSVFQRRVCELHRVTGGSPPPAWWGANRRLMSALTGTLSRMLPPDSAPAPSIRIGNRNASSAHIGLNTYLVVYSSLINTGCEASGNFD